MKRQIKVYVAGPWFTPHAEKTLTIMENMATLSKKVKAYRPRLDGIKLKPGEFHDPKLRQDIFEDNVKNIDTCDFVVANLDSRDGVMDTGTLWEIGYAVSKDKKVYVYDPAEKSSESLRGLYANVTGEIRGQIELGRFFEDPEAFHLEYCGYEYGRLDIRRVLLVTPHGKSEEYTDIAVILNDIFHSNFVWANGHDSARFGDEYDFMLYDTDLVVAVIDDKDPIVSYTMGYAYNKDIPVVTYTNYDYDVNIMLLCSIVKHVKGLQSLRVTLEKLYAGGVDALPEFDHSGIKAE